MGRFPLLLILLAVGLGAAWGVCRFTTPCYEARCDCEVTFGQPAEGGFEESLNTRLATWQAELQGAWPDVEVARVPRSRLVAATARGVRAEDVAARANGCAEALVSFTETTGVARAEAPLAQIHAEVEQRRQADERLAKELLARATRMAGSEQRLRALHRAVVDADAEGAQAALRSILLDSPSYHDLVDEGDYHVLLLALLYAVDGYRPATSNRESGDGRADVLLEPRPNEAGGLPAIVMELKLDREAGDDESRLAACARDVALAQAVRLGYGHGMAGAGLVRWGIAFCGKHVACVCESRA